MTLQDAIDEYGPLVLHIAWRITGDEATTQDVCQETFLKLHRTWQSGRRIEHLKAWLARLAVNAALDAKRHGARQVPFDDDVALPVGPGGIAAGDRRLLLAQIHRRIPDLPERQREVFLLRHFEGLSFDEIARLVGCSPGAARAASFQALRKMRAWLTGETGVGADTTPEGALPRTAERGGDGR